jgi:CheY-like chemotaxis protein
MDTENILFIDNNFEPLRPVLDSAAKIKGINMLYFSEVGDDFEEEIVSAIILDLHFSGQATKGEDVLKELKKRYPDIPIVVLTESFNDTEVAIRCIKNGAFDFIRKSSLDVNLLFQVLDNALNQTNLKHRLTQKPKISLNSSHPSFLFKKELMCCQFAYKLSSISMQTDSDLFDNLIRASYRWHYNLLYLLLPSYREYVIPGLIMIKPKEKAEIEFYLVFSLYGPNEENVKILAKKFYTSIDPYVLSLYESHTRPYVLESVNDSEILNKILYPGFNKPAIRLYSEPICWGSAVDYNLDVNDGKQVLNADFLPKINAGALYSNYNLLAQSLLSATGISYLCIQIQQLKLMDNEKEFLNRIINKEIEPPTEIPEEIVNKYIARYKDILTTPSDNFLFEVRYLSDTHNRIPRPLDIEIKRHFYSERSIVKTTLQVGLFDNLFSIDKNRKLSRLAFIKRSNEASMIFCLPEPAAKPVKGIPYQNASLQIFPVNLSSTGLLMGEKLIGRETIPVRIDTESLKKHMYLLGQTGTGKTTLLKSMILDAISGNYGFCVIDPHGDLIEDVQKMIPETRKKDIVWFDTSNLKDSAKMNLLIPEISVKQSMLVDEIIRILTFEYDYKNVGGPIFETYFKSALNLVMHPEVIRKFSTPTLQLAYKALLFPDFLKHLISLTECVNESDDQTTDFSTERIVGSELGQVYRNAFLVRGETDWDSMRPYIYSKLKFFIDNVYIRELFDSKEPTLNFRNIMDNGKILLVRIEKGHIGMSNLAKIGMLFLNKLIFSIMTRTELPVEKRRDFFIFIDEFQNFLQGDIGIALSEVRKYNVGLVLANQTIGQLNDYLLQSVLGNVGSTAFFRTGINDIGKISHFIEPEFSARELINLQNFNCIARIMHNNRPSEPFIFQTIKM